MAKKLSNSDLQERLETLEDDLSRCQEETAYLYSLFDTFLEGSKSLLNHQGFDETARSLFDLCKKQIGARSGYIALLSENGMENEVLFLDSGGLSCSVNHELPMPIRGLRAQVYATAEPAYENDFENSRWMEFMPKGHVSLKNVMFAPLVHDGKTVGLLGLANKTSDFDAGDARIAGVFGKLAAVALREARRMDEVQKAETALRRSEARFRSLFNTMNEGVCLHEIVYAENGKPIDYRILDVNPAYERITGIPREEARNKKASELYRTGEPPYFDVYSHVAGKGTPESFEIFWPPIKKHLRISVFSPRKGQFATVFTDITDQKEKEELLQVSEEYLSTTLNSIGDGVITTDTRGRVVRMNPVAEELTGRQLSEAKDRPLEEVFNILNEKTGRKVENPVTKVIRKGTIVGLANHTVLASKNGKKYFIDDSAAPIKNHDGNVIGAVLIFRDSTAKYRADEAIRQSEKKYRQLFEKSTDAIFIVHKSTGRYLTANASAEELTGYSLSELKKLTTRDVTLEGAKKRLKTIESAGGTVEFGEVVYVRPDGSERIAMLSSVPLDDDTVYGIAQDITERKRTEEALRTSHERFLTVLDSIDATVHVADMETHEVLFMNKYMLECFGRDMVGERCWEVFRGESGPCPYCINDKLLDEDGKPTGVCVWQDRNPITGKWYMNYDRAIEWTDGRLVRIQIATDITEMKRLENQLQEAQKMESIGNLAGGVAHDFNNILFPIIGLSELLLEDLIPGSPEYENVQEILQAGKRGSNLVKQILTFSRQSEHRMTPVRIQQILKEVLKLIRSTIPSNIEISQYIQPDCGLVMADPTQLHQIVMNLITNAYHAVDSTNGKISIQLREKELGHDDLAGMPLKSGQYAILTVTDTGNGIAPAIRDKIFEPYFTTKKHGKGTGLGLAVVYGIVKEYNGHIKVHSEVGEGTAFNIYLPLMETSSKTVSVEKVGSYRGGTERVLLVDDEDPIVQLAKKMLKRLGYRVTSSTSSLDALAAFSGNPDAFDVVVTDMTMPNMTGDKLAKEIFSIRPDIPIIICTGFSEGISRDMAKAMGINGFLMKPIVKSEMAQMVRKVLDQAKDSTGD